SRAHESAPHVLPGRRVVATDGAHPRTAGPRWARRNAPRTLTVKGAAISSRPRRRSQVVKAEVCKTSMHRFDSGRRLQFSLALFVGIACHDPPTPPPTQGPDDLPRWSLAPHVSWAGLDAPATRPLAVFVDDPGGPLDQIAADADVTTFLNDR